MRIKKYLSPAGALNKRYTDKDFEGTGWHYIPVSDIKKDDKLRDIALKQGESDYLVDENGYLVPSSAVNNFLKNLGLTTAYDYYYDLLNLSPISKNLNSYFQQQSDANDRVSLQMRLRAADRLANRLTPGVGTFVVAPLALTAAGIGGAAALPYLLPGTLGGNIIGTTAFGEALNHAIKYGTGKTMGEHAVNAAHYLGIPQSLWGDYGIQMLGDMPLYITGDIVGKQIANAGRTLTKETLNQLALDNTFKDIPMVQVGEIPASAKNTTRNAIERQALSMGADGIIYQGIKDNQLENQTIVKALNPDLRVTVSKIIENNPHLVTNNPRVKLQGAEPEYKYNPKTGEFDISYPRGLRRLWATEARDDVISYFNSDVEYNRLLLSGATPEQALQIMAVRGANTENALPIVFRNLRSNVYGDALNINGQALVRLNQRSNSRASLSDPDVLKHTVYHELGGHGSSLNIGEQAVTVPENQIDILTQIYKHNEALRPELRPFYQAVKDGNFELAKQIAPEGVLKTRNGEINFKEIQDLIKYMEENLEYVARAHASNIAKHTGLKDGWNIEQLRKYFTDKSTDNLLKNVWTILPLGYGLPQLDQPTSNRKGGRLIPRKY